MTSEPYTTPLSRFASASIALEVLLAIGAIAGGLVLIVAPRGDILPLLVSALEGSPFDTYLWPGVILFTVLGLGPLVAAAMAWRRRPVAPFAALAVGAALLIRVVVEVAIIGYATSRPSRRSISSWASSSPASRWGGR